MSQGSVGKLTNADGVSAVELARDALRTYVVDGQRRDLGRMRDAFYVRTGALVQLEGSGGRLRGCAGECRSTKQLGETVVSATIDAAGPESCGSEIQPAELGGIRVSVCILREPTTVTAPLEDLTVGRDVAVVRRGDLSGWLFPTVAAEQGWTAEEYLERTCRTAGLHPDEWAGTDVTVTLVPGVVYRERRSGTDIVQITPPSNN